MLVLSNQTFQLHRLSRTKPGETLSWELLTTQLGVTRRSLAIKSVRDREKYHLVLVNLVCHKKRMTETKMGL